MKRLFFILIMSLCITPVWAGGLGVPGVISGSGGGTSSGSTALDDIGDPDGNGTINMGSNYSLILSWDNKTITFDSTGMAVSGTGSSVAYALSVNSTADIAGTVSVSAPVITTSTLEGLVGVKSSTASTTVTTANCDGTYWYAGTSDAITFTLPSAAVGLICAFSNIHYAGTITVDTATGDILMLGSTVLDAGDKTSCGDTNAMATFMAVDTTYWSVTMGNGSWSDAGQ